ncbi:protein HEXIM1 [Danaus plexippus]|uniref:protein HEXIM1 n=1 Tax=Danaus plexippus TaxID=13037 RepID=UPI002AB20BC9|nr:protein HEXIM1 [Danaus plexippus]
MDIINNISDKDGDSTRALVLVEAPSILEVPKHNFEGNLKKKRRRGKTKRKISKPFSKMSWQERRKVDNTKRNNRFRKIVLTKTQAPFNNNQFLMEIHKPEPENNFLLYRTPSARTRDSSFSIDSEDNYFHSLPEDEEEYLTKEFSSVYEDAQCERLSNMSKNELIQEYLLLEAKYDNLVKRNERFKMKDSEDEQDTTVTDKEVTTDKDSMLTDRDTSGASAASGSIDEPSMIDILQQLKEQSAQIHELQMANEKLLLENKNLRQRNQGSSEDSESDSSSTSDTCSSSSCTSTPEHQPEVMQNGNIENQILVNGNHDSVTSPQSTPLVNGFHSPHE